MSTIWLTVDVAPGTDITNACQDAVALANRTCITIWFDFNGVKCLARPGDNPEGIQASWRVEMKKDTPNRIASDSAS